MFPSSIRHVNHKPYFYFRVHKLVDTSFKFASTFLHFSFRFYINVYTMYVFHSCDEKSLFFIHFLINTINICRCSTRYGNMCTIKRILKGTMKIHCTRTRHGQQWPVNGANVEIVSNCFCTHWNLTWIDYSHALRYGRVSGLKFDSHTHLFPSSIHHVNHKPYFSFKVQNLVDTSFKFASTFLHFSFRFYIKVYTMYLCHSCDEKSLFFHSLFNQHHKSVPLQY